MAWRLNKWLLAMLAVILLGGLSLAFLLAAGWGTAGLGGVAGLGEPVPPSSARENRPDASVVGPGQGAPAAAEGSSRAALRLPEAPALQDGELALAGEGFAPGEAVVISVSDDAGGQLRQIGEVRADDQGRLPGEALTLPEWLLSGAHTLVAAGKQSGREARETLYVRAKQGWIQLQDYAVRQAGRLGMVAGGFAPAEQVNLYLAPGQDRPAELPAEPLATVGADKAGNTDWSEFTLPLLMPGKYALIVRGATSQVEVLRVIEVQPLIPLFTLDPWSGPPGSRVALAGQGYKPGEQVRVTFGGSNEPVATLTADAYGNVYSVDPLEVPRTLGGDVTVTLEGLESGARAVQRFSVVGGRSAGVWGELSSYAGPPGEIVYLAGGGYASGENVSVHVGDRNGPVVATGQSLPDGRLAGLGPVTIPAAAGDELTFTIVGESSGAESAVRYKVLRPLGEPVSP